MNELAPLQSNVNAIKDADDYFRRRASTVLESIIKRPRDPVEDRGAATSRSVKKIMDILHVWPHAVDQWKIILHDAEDNIVARAHVNPAEHAHIIAEIEEAIDDVCALYNFLGWRRKVASTIDVIRCRAIAEFAADLDRVA